MLRRVAAFAPRSARISPSTTSTVPVGASRRSRPRRARHARPGAPAAGGRRRRHRRAPRPRRSAPRSAAQHAAFRADPPATTRDARLVALAHGDDVDHQVADGDEADHAARRARRVELLGARPALRERPKRLEHGPRVALVPFRGERQRLVEGAAAVGARQRERREQAAGLAAGKHPQQLDDRRRAPDLVRGRSGGVGAARRSDPADGGLRQCVEHLLREAQRLRLHAHDVARQLVARVRQHEHLRVAPVPLHRLGERLVERGGRVHADVRRQLEVLLERDELQVLARHHLVDRAPRCSRPTSGSRARGCPSARAGSSRASPACTASSGPSAPGRGSRRPPSRRPARGSRR